MKYFEETPLRQKKEKLKKELCFIVKTYATRRESKGTAQRLSELDKSGANRSSSVWYTFIYYAK